MKRLMLLSTALIFSATMSLAAITADELVLAYQAQGYTRIEVKTGLTQIKVEAVTGNSKVEVIYDALTGAILQQETSRANPDDLSTGVEVSQEDHDFLGQDSAHNSGNDDGSADNAGNDDGSADNAGNDDGSADNSGNDDGSADNAGDDGQDNSGPGSDHDSDGAGSDSDSGDSGKDNSGNDD